MTQGPTDGWARAWDLFLEQRDSLQGVLKSMQGYGLNGEDAQDLLHAFVLNRLPQIAESIKALSPDQGSAYVRASLRNFVRDALRSRKRHEAALNRLANELSSISLEAGGASLDIAPSVNLSSLVAQLPTAESRALSMFFGFQDSPKSIREIATALKTSRYAANLLVLDGLIAAALALGERGALSEIELEACRQVILNGLSFEVVAENLGLSPSRVRRALWHARSAASASLHSQEIERRP